MIKVINQKFFHYDLQFVEDNTIGEYLILINFMADPADIVTMDTYRKSPLATAILVTPDKNTFLSLRALFPQNTSDISSVAIPHGISMILDLLKMNPVNIFNKYTNVEEYAMMCKKFDPSKNYHSILSIVELNEAFFATDPHLYDRLYDWNKMIVIGALPVRGIVSQIPKSPRYVLYNGALVRTPSYQLDQPIKYYSKVVYILTEVISSFQMDEFITEGPNLGTYRSHLITGPNLDRMDDPYLDLKYEVNDYMLPVEGREYIYEKSSANIFVISDRPNQFQSRQFAIKM